MSDGLGSCGLEGKPSLVAYIQTHFPAYSVHRLWANHSPSGPCATLCPSTTHHPHRFSSISTGFLTIHPPVLLSTPIHPYPSVWAPCPHLLTCPSPCLSPKSACAPSPPPSVSPHPHP